jgi:hypothetical protein
MKPLQLLATSLLAAVSINAFAAEPYGENTAEQKEVLASEDLLREVTDKLNRNCGTSVKTTINWKAYDAIKGLSPEQKDNRDMANLYRMAGMQNESDLQYIADGCKDNLYKNNVAKKLKSIVVTPRAGNISAKEPSHVFKLANGTLNITYHIYTRNTTTDTAAKLF